MSVNARLPDEMTKTNGAGIVRIPDEISEHVGADEEGKLLWFKEDDGSVTIRMKPDDDN